MTDLFKKKPNDFIYFIDFASSAPELKVQVSFSDHLLFCRLSISLSICPLENIFDFYSVTLKMEPNLFQSILRGWKYLIIEGKGKILLKREIIANSENRMRVFLNISKDHRSHEMPILTPNIAYIVNILKG